MAPAKSPKPGELRPLRRAEYDKLIEAGCFEGENIELLGGVLVAREHPGPYHSHLVSRLGEHLIRLHLTGARVRQQNPFAATDESEPQPDIAVVPEADYRREHPRKAWLLIEISGASVGVDRGAKARIYAQADVDEYWVVDLEKQHTDVFRGRHDGQWTSLVRVPWTDPLSPVRFPELSIRIADFG